jgi:hypothetical protein
MLRLDAQAGERLEEPTTYFGASNVEVIRQRIAQARPEAFPQGWRMAVAERRHPNTTELSEAMHTAPHTAVSGGIDAPRLL